MATKAQLQAELDRLNIVLKTIIKRNKILGAQRDTLRTQVEALKAGHSGGYKEAVKRLAAMYPGRKSFTKAEVRNEAQANLPL